MDGQPSCKSDPSDRAGLEQSASWDVLGSDITRTHAEIEKSHRSGWLMEPWMQMTGKLQSFSSFESSFALPTLFTKITTCSDTLRWSACSELLWATFSLSEHMTTSACWTPHPLTCMLIAKFKVIAKVPGSAALDCKAAHEFVAQELLLGPPRRQ